MPSIAPLRSKAFGQLPPLAATLKSHPYDSECGNYASNGFPACIGVVSVFTLVVLGLSAHVNHFMGFFCKCLHQPGGKDKRALVLDVADRFPFIMSILTLLILVPLCVLVVSPILEIDVLSLL